MDVWDFTGRIVDCEREYQTLNENLRGLITFHHFVSYKNPSWSKDKVTHWIGVVEEKRAREARWERDEIYFEITCLEIKYSALSKETRAQITFPQYVALRNPSWSEEDVLHGIIVAEEKRAAIARWLEEQRNPTPIRSTQLCYSCKVPWEPDHRCRGKGQKHIIEVRHDSDDEACEDGSIDAYLEQSDDDSDSCTEASDSDSCTEA
jgi:hypothetical protein